MDGKYKSGNDEGFLVSVIIKDGFAEETILLQLSRRDINKIRLSNEAFVEKIKNVLKKYREGNKDRYCKPASSCRSGLKKIAWELERAIFHYEKNWKVLEVNVVQIDASYLNLK